MGQINVNYIKTLLYRGESETLDFKAEQYRFKGATDDEKFELLKDIIALANAWKSSDGYIIIGAKEVLGGRVELLNIDEHPDDASIQQFIQSKVNKSVKFNYHVITIDDCKLGVLKINRQQERPIYLHKDFGKLKKEIVYVRRGSSTGQASIEEIAQMGADDIQEKIVPVVDFEFAHERIKLGKKIVLNSLRLSESARQIYVIPMRHSVFSIYNEPKASEIFEWMNRMISLNRVSFYIKNNSTVLAEDISLVLKGKNIDSLEITDHLPNKPEFYTLPVMPIVSQDYLEVFDEYWVATCSIGKIQPQCEIWYKPDVYFRAKKDCIFEVEATMSGDNIPKPTVTNLQIQINVIEIDDQEKALALLENWDEFSEETLLGFPNKVRINITD